MNKTRIEAHPVALHRRLALIALGAVAATLLAAWLATSPPAKAASARGSAAGATIKLAKNTLGQILVDSRGHTVYLFEKDKKGQSACYTACAKYWPPVLAKGKPAAGLGVKAALLGVAMRKDGTHQVTYAGHPLYRFFKDKASGQATGQGLSFFGGGWYVLSPRGMKIDEDKGDSSSSGTSSTSSNGYGSGYSYGN